MNCQTFISIITTSARGETAQPDERESLRAHAEECCACARSLATQQKLTKALCVLREETTGASDAPAYLESILRENFRRKHAPTDARPTVVPFVARRASDASTTNARPHTSANRFVGGWQRHAPLAAAIIVAIVIVTLASIVSRNALERKAESLSAQKPYAAPSGLNAETAANVIGTNESAANAPVSNAEEENHVAIDDRQVELPDSVLEKTSSLAVRTPNRRNSTRVANTRAALLRAATIENATATSAPADAEVATAFLPLLEAGSLAGVESVHVVRVRLPRSSLAAMGLPMNPDRAGESVTADVLLGEDGVARAIRFVR